MLRADVKRPRPLRVNEGAIMCSTANRAVSRSDRRSHRGFTLIEILIVVVIIGILAAIVLPQFSNASVLARENTLKDELRYLRTQISVYKAQHRDYSPGYLNGAVAGSPDAVLVQQLTQFSDDYGNVSGTADNIFKYGPYLTKMPANSLTSDATLKVVTGPGPLVADDSTGWLYNVTTADIIANSTKTDTTGTPYAQY
jgi:general secretion pathway protein G